MATPIPTLPLSVLQATIAHSPLTVHPSTCVQEAIAQLIALQETEVDTSSPLEYAHQNTRAGCVLVLEGEQLQGILTERDIVRLFARGQDLTQVPIQAVMSAPVISLTESELTDPEQILNLFQRHRIRHLPILTDRGQVTGLISDESFHDIVWHWVQDEMGERIATEQALKTQRDFNQLIAEISSRFVDLNVKDLEAEINRTLQLVGEMTGVDTSYLLRIDRDRNTLSMTHEWSRPHCLRQIDLVQNLPLTMFPWATAKLFQREVIHVPWVEDLPPEAAIDQVNWQQLHLTAVLTVPLIQKSQVTGFMGFASFGDASNWDEETIRLLHVMGQTIANAQERTSTEQRLHESEERLRLALKAANQGLYDLNLQTGEAIVNAEYALMLGYDPETFQETNAKWIERLHPDDRERVSLVYQDYVTGILPEYKVEFRQRTQAGDYKWILSLGQVLEWDTTGQPLRMLGTHTDISDRKQAEAQARHRLDILEAARDIIASADVEGQVTYLNQAGRTQLGMDPQADVLQTWIPDYHSPQVAHFLVQEVLPHSVRHGFWAGETHFRRLDGTEFPVWQVVVCHRHPDGSVSHFSTIARDITDLKQAEEERFRAKQLWVELTLLENILDIILAGYWDWDIPNGTEYLSPGFKRMFGYADHELPNVPESWQRLIFEEDLLNVYACFNRHIESHGTVPFYNEVRYHHKDGSTIWVICSGQVIEWDLTGQPLRMIGCHIDITDRKKAEEAIAQYSREVEDLYNNAPCGYHSLDINGRFIAVNNTELHWLGYTREEILGKSFADLLTGASVLAFEVNYPLFKQRGWVKDLEFDLIRKDGTIFPVFLSATAVNDATGNYLYSRSMLFDARDRKQAEELLRKQDAHLKTAQRIGKLGSWEFDVQTEQITWSDEVFRIFGRDPEQAPPSFAELQTYFHPEDREHHQRVVETAIATVQPYDIECRIYRLNGTLIYIQARGEPIVDARGQLVQLVGTILDITERKQTETQLRQITAQLEASNRELEAFAYSVSHDLRSPLRAIDGFSQALLEDYGDQFDAEGRDYFDRIRHNVQRMGLLIDDLLRLSRVSRSEMQYSDVNLSTLVLEQVHELRLAEPNRQVDVVVIPDAIVFADATLMRVVISNLVQNAWKFTSHHATARIEFGVTILEKKPTYFVQDDGAGFDMTYAKMLFGVFQRLHNTHEFPGTGIGLATVQRAIHRHGGQVWAEGAVERGATIYFTIPSTPIRTGI